MWRIRYAALQPEANLTVPKYVGTAVIDTCHLPDGIRVSTVLLGWIFFVYTGARDH